MKLTKVDEYTYWILMITAPYIFALFFSFVFHFPKQLFIFFIILTGKLPGRAGRRVALFLRQALANKVNESLVFAGHHRASEKTVHQHRVGDTLPYYGRGSHD